MGLNSSSHPAAPALGQYQVAHPGLLRQSSVDFILQPWPCVSQCSARLQDPQHAGGGQRLTRYGHKQRTVRRRSLSPLTRQEGTSKASRTHRGCWVRMLMEPKRCLAWHLHGPDCNVLITAWTELKNGGESLVSA